MAHESPKTSPKTPPKASHSEKKKPENLVTVAAFIELLKECPQDAVLYVGGKKGVVPISLEKSTQHNKMSILLNRSGQPDPEFAPMQPERLQYLTKEQFVEPNAPALSSVTVLALRGVDGTTSDGPDKHLSELVKK